MNSKHQKYLNEAEELYSSANGYDEDFAYDGMADAFAANALQGDLDENRLYADGSEAAAATTIPDFDRTYTLTLTNTVAVDTPVTIFGANQFLTAVNFGLPATVTAAVGESSYQEMLFETQNSPFIISGFRVTSANATQLDQVLTITKRDGNGQTCSYPLQVGNYFSAFQFQAGIREVYPYNITMAGTTRISFTLLASATVVLVFFVGKRLGIDNKLHGKPITEVSVHKLPFVARQQLTLAPNTIAALRG
jgi:hypothetical protein